VKELQNITRKFVDQIHDIIGPDKDIPAPDVGTGAREMAWIRNQYEKYHGFNPACVTGKPVEHYGAEGREEATGRGVGILAYKLLGNLGKKPKETTVSLQGFGNVGSHAAKFLHESEYKIVAVGDQSGGYYKKDGLDIPKMLRHSLDNQGCWLAFGMPSESVTILGRRQSAHPAALGGVIARNAARIKVSSSRRPTARLRPDATQPERGLMLPDIWPMRGVTVSYFSGCRTQYYKWPPIACVKVGTSFPASRAWEATCRISLRTAAYDRHPPRTPGREAGRVG
jgi:glutamate dehydrogenase (NAD(P)+)